MPGFTRILALAIPIGTISTLAMDAMATLRKRIWGVAPLDYGLVGRWIGHLMTGRFMHEAIGRSTPIRGETMLGWFAHYAMGVVFAAGLIVLCGWEPSLVECLLAGLLTSAAPLFMLQPGMGLRVAASKAPQPNIARLHTLVTPLSFGWGLYLRVRFWSALT
jgi:hypothetical protein